MAKQYSITLRNNWLQDYEDTIGPSPYLRWLTGNPPVNCAAAQTGTLLIEFTLPSNWQAAPSGGEAEKSGTWSGTAVANGTARYYRFYEAGSPLECHEQGLLSSAFSLTTSDDSSNATCNVLIFADTSAVVVGQAVYGDGIPSGATVLAKTPTTVSISRVSTSTILEGSAIFFGDTAGDLFVPNTTITIGQIITLTDRTMIAPGP